jgi:hypothetical protein
MLLSQKSDITQQNTRKDLNMEDRNNGFHNEHGNSNDMSRRGFVNRLVKYSTGSALALALLPGQEKNQANAQTASKNLRTRQGNPTVETANSQFFFAADYGVIADGVTNDAPALQACADDVVANGGGRVVLPEGTIKISTQCGFVGEVGDQYGANVTLIGGKHTDIKFTVGGRLAFGNCGQVEIKDINFIGTNDSTLCSDTQSLGVFFCTLVNIENCRFYGLGNSAATDIYAGCLLIWSTPGAIRNCWFAGCAAPNNAVVTVNGKVAVLFENVNFVDLSAYKGITYSTAAKAVGRAWVWLNNFDNAGSGGNRASTFVQCSFDEAPFWGIYADASGATTQKYSLYINRCGFNGGIDYGGGVFSRALYAKGFQNVEFTRTNVYWQNNNTEYNPIEIEDCELLEINKVIFRYGAKYIKLSGTTKRVKVIDSDLQGSETFPNGFENQANALIDSDFSISTSTSDTTLVPTGLFMHVTGTNTISSIMTTNLKVGDSLTLIFDDKVTITDRMDGSNLKLAGNFRTTPNTTLVLKYDGSNFYEMSRSINTN